MIFEKIKDRSLSLGLVFVVALSLLPHMAKYPLEVMAVGGLSLAWRLLFEFKKTQLPHFTIKLFLIILCGAWFFTKYESFIGLESGTSLLLMAMSLKLIDNDRYHDFMIILFTSLLALLAKVLESQSLWITLFGAFDLIIVMSLLLRLHSHAELKFNLKSFLKNGALLILQVSPMMALLFFVFPRISNEMGFASRRQFMNSTPSMKDISPGQVAYIASSDTQVFRVKRMKNGQLSEELAYWRGIVLNHNEGMLWSRSFVEKVSPKKNKMALQNTMSYQQVLLEPVYGHWVFTEDKPQDVQLLSLPKTRLNEYQDGVFTIKNRPNERVVYQTQTLTLKQKKLSKKERLIYLQKPEEKDFRVHFLVSEIRDGARSNIEISKKLLMFYKQHYSYDINSVSVSKTSLSQFLFEKKKGFSEHFANSFAALMRLAEVPARVVVGFHGGEVNAIDHLITITEKDIHTWVEIWSEKHLNWVRVDPTMVVAPLREKLGGQLYHRLSQEQLAKTLSPKQHREVLQKSSHWSKNLAERSFSLVQSMSSWWTLFLLKYDEKGQLNFFKRFGLHKLSGAYLWLVTFLFLVAFYFMYNRKNKKVFRKLPKNEKYFQEFCHFLAKKGWKKKPEEGPMSFVRRVEGQFDGQKQNLAHFSENYILWKYSLPGARVDSKVQGRLLKQLVRQKIIQGP